MNLDLDLDTVLLGNSLTAWITAVGLAVVIFAVAILAQSVLTRRLARLAQRTDTVWDDALVKGLRRTRRWLVMVVAIYLGSRSLELPMRIDTGLRWAATVCFFMQIGLWVTTFVTALIDRAPDVDDPIKKRTSALGVVARFILWAAVVLLALANLGVNVTALVAGLGIGGIAIALSLQNILGDLFASLSILLDKPFVIGDFVIVDDYVGTVEHIGIKTTRMRSLSGEQLVFANGDLLKARLRNFKQMQQRRIVFSFGVLYETPREQLGRIPQIVGEIIKAQPFNRFDRAHLKGFGDSSIDFEVVYTMTDPDYGKYMDVQQGINLAMIDAFAAEGIEFAYPTQTLHLAQPLRIETAGAGAAKPA